MQGLLLQLVMVALSVLQAKNPHKLQAQIIMYVLIVVQLNTARQGQQIVKVVTQILSRVQAAAPVCVTLDMKQQIQVRLQSPAENAALESFHRTRTKYVKIAIKVKRRHRKHSQAVPHAVSVNSKKQKVLGFVGLVKKEHSKIVILILQQHASTASKVNMLIHVK